MPTAVAHPNIALCKYWGKRDRALNLPANASLSLTLSPFETRTRVVRGTEHDVATLGERPMSEPEARRAFRLLDLLDPGRPPCRIETANNFPTAAGLASSASGFAALALAAAAASGRALTHDELAVFARRGSGSATRSIHGGWVEWRMGERVDGTDSHGVRIAGPEHWDVRMVVAVIGAGPKNTGSTEGMLHTQASSPYYPAWTAAAAGDVDQARRAVLDRDLEGLGRVMERSSMRMHASMLAADPPLLYWRPGSVATMEAVWGLRKRGIGAFLTMDAGPNVKVLCEARDAAVVAGAIAAIAERVEILAPGGAARLE